MAIDDYWFKNAVIYCLNVATYMDCNGDGIGDFEGLSRRLDYLHGLGVTCVAAALLLLAQPRQRLRRVRLLRRHARFGTAGDFVECMNHAHALGMRVVVDLVANHTSIDHSWFQSARADPKSPYRDWYVWADKRPRGHASGTVFPPMQSTTWTRDKKARKYYFHRFYEHQADLNTHHPAYREELYKIMGYWLQLGVSGFRMDAVPFLVERKGANVKPVKDFALLQEMRRFLQWRARRHPARRSERAAEREHALLRRRGRPAADDAQLPGESAPTTPSPPAIRSRSSARSARRSPTSRATRSGSSSCAATTSSTSAGSPTSSESACSRYSRRRRTCSSTTAASGGVSRRCSATTGAAWSSPTACSSLPGTPMIQYGDEIGMGEDLSLKEREATRTPMQWTAEPHGGFTCRQAAAAGDRPRRIRLPEGQRTRSGATRAPS